MTTFESVDKVLKLVKVVLLSIVLFCGSVFNFIRWFLTLEFVDTILRCDHSNESYWPVLSCVAV